MRSRRALVAAVGLVAFAWVMIGSSAAAGLGGRGATASKARVPLGVRVLTPRPQPAASRSGSLAVPSRGTAPPVTLNRTANRVRSTKPGVVAYKPAPPLLPRVGKVLPGIAATGAARNRAEANGHLNLTPTHTGGAAPARPRAARRARPQGAAFHPLGVLQLDTARQLQRAVRVRRQRDDDRAEHEQPQPARRRRQHATTTTAATARTPTPASTTPPTAASTGTSR